MPIKLNPDVESCLIDSLKAYFEDELEYEIGDLRAKILLRFLVGELGPFIYNQAIRDAAAFFHERAADLEVTCYEPEPHR